MKEGARTLKATITDAMFGPFLLASCSLHQFP
jgi:hypothetical protein